MSVSAGRALSVVVRDLVRDMVLHSIDQRSVIEPAIAEPARKLVLSDEVMAPKCPTNSALRDLRWNYQPSKVYEGPALLLYGVPVHKVAVGKRPNPAVLPSSATDAVFVSLVSSVAVVPKFNLPAETWG